MLSSNSLKVCKYEVLTCLLIAMALFSGIGDRAPQLPLEIDRNIYQSMEGERTGVFLRNKELSELVYSSGTYYIIV